MKSNLETAKIHLYDDYRLFLHDFAQENRKKNPRWSYGAWAKKLGLKSKSQLIMTVQGKRRVSPKLAERLVQYFHFSPDEESYFKRLVSIEAKEKTTIHKIEMNDRSNLQKKMEINGDSPLLQNSWLGFVVKEAVTLLGASFNLSSFANSICTKPSISQLEEILKSLVEIGYLIQEKSIDGAVRYTAAKSSPDLHWPKESMEKMLSDGLRVCESQGKHLRNDERIFQTSFIRIRKERMAEAKVLIRAFQKELMREFETDDGNEVVQFNLHLFPVTSGLKS